MSPIHMVVVPHPGDIRFCQISSRLKLSHYPLVLKLAKKLTCFEDLMISVGKKKTQNVIQYRKTQNFDTDF